MRKGSANLEKSLAETLKRPMPHLDEPELKRFVQSFLRRRDEFLWAVQRADSPSYVIDAASLKSRARQFKKAFGSVFDNPNIYYAMKSNSHPIISELLVDEGFGLDVSSGLELRAALSTGAKDIIFSGPGKNQIELNLAANNAQRVTILMDSFRELERLDRVSRRVQKKVRAGVRLTTDETGLWKKFGIPPSKLKEFFEAAGKCQFIDLCGLQFHISWNLNPNAQIDFIARLGDYLNDLGGDTRGKIEFIDVGGGFWPEVGEWQQRAATPQGMIEAALGESNLSGYEHFRQPSSPITEFAKGISSALKTHLPKDMSCTICLEPGRWLCNDAMHILLTVIDVKSPELVITDGGTNAVGWERFETDYFPIINLSRPGLDEQECLISGSLCTPHDIWGYGYFGDGIKEGDILLVPNQGAYTYSLRQEFIKPLPGCISLKESDPSEKIIEADILPDDSD